MEDNRHYSDIRFEILENYKNMSEQEMHDALVAFADAINRAAVKNIESAIYWIKQNH